MINYLLNNPILLFMLPFPIILIWNKYVENSREQLLEECAKLMEMENFKLEDYFNYADTLTSSYKEEDKKYSHLLKDSFDNLILSICPSNCNISLKGMDYFVYNRKERNIIMNLSNAKIQELILLDNKLGGSCK